MENEECSEMANNDGLIATEQNKQYIAELINERQNLDASFAHAARLLDLEISNAQSGHEKVKLLELHNDKPTRVALKVKVPVDEYPKFNFIGKIIGPKGNSLKRIQEGTECRMAVYGRGSMRDKEKEEELRQQGGKYAHLNDDLHVHVETFGHPIDVYRRLSFALHELRRHLVPDYNDDVTQSQVQELAALNGGGPAAGGRGRGRGARSAPLRGGNFPPHRNMAASRGRGVAGLGRPGPAAGSPDLNPAPLTEAYRYEAGLNDPFKTEDFDGRSAGNGAAFSQQSSSFKSVAGARSLNPPSAASGFNSQTDNAYDNFGSSGWVSNSDIFKKPPPSRLSGGQARSHPYAPR